MRIGLLIFFCFSIAQMFGQTAHKNLRMGDRLYEDGYFKAAEEQYREASQKDGGQTKGTFNLGNSLYYQERLQEAANQYERHIESTDDSTTLAAAYHNLGNTYYKLQQYDKSVEAYKNALRRNPNDIDTKKNLVQAMRELRAQQQQQQQQQNQQNQPPPPDENQDQEQQQQQQQQQQQEEEEENEQPSEPQEKEELSPEEAEQLLKIVDKKDQEVQEKLRKVTGKKDKPKKDW